MVANESLNRLFIRCAPECEGVDGNDILSRGGRVFVSGFLALHLRTLPLRSAPLSIGMSVAKTFCAHIEITRKRIDSQRLMWRTLLFNCA